MEFSDGLSSGRYHRDLLRNPLSCCHGNRSGNLCTCGFNQFFSRQTFRCEGLCLRLIYLLVSSFRLRFNNVGFKHFRFRSGRFYIRLGNLRFQRFRQLVFDLLVGVGVDLFGIREQGFKPFVFGVVL